MIERLTDAILRPGASAVRVGLMLGGIVLSAVVIFGLGVMVGSRVAALAPGPPPATAPPPGVLPAEAFPIRPAAPAAQPAPAPPDKLTFYDRLSGVAPAATAALPEAQPAVQKSPAAQQASQTPPAPRPETTPPRMASAPSPRKNAAPDTPATKTAVPKSDPAAQIRKLSGKGRFTVQMAAVSERAAAAEMAALIKRNGFDAVTVMASAKGKILYRIRVGSFPNKQAAAQAAGIFRSAFGLNGIAVEN